MSKIICKAYFLQPAAGIIVAVSPSFQAALTPWILTLSAEKCLFSCWMTEIASFALAPTFQFTRSLAVHLRTYEEKQQLMNTDLCVPLFSHMKTLKLSYSHRRNKIRFDHGNEVADFILKFQRLEIFELRVHPESTPPSEFIAFYVRLFHSQSISQTLLVSAVKSYTNNIRRCYRSDFFSRNTMTQEEYSELLIKHKIIPYLVQKMVEVYRNDHGESLCSYLEAIFLSRRSVPNDEELASDEEAESDPIDELVPMFDLLETIVINGDLLHPCFQPQQEEVLDPQQRKWTLAMEYSRAIYFCLVRANYSPLEFMRRYGRTLLPQLADAIFSNYDGSDAAVSALMQCLDMFRLVIEDYFWIDEVESETDEEGLKKMLQGGRSLLQHFPFDKIAFMIPKAIAIEQCPSSDLIVCFNCTSHDLMVYFTRFVSGLKFYCNEVASLSSELKEAVARDVAPKMIEHNILPLCFDFLVSSFVDCGMDRGARERSSQLLGGICAFLQPINSRTTDRLSSVLAKDFFLRDGIVQKLMDFGDTVCDDFEEVFNMLRYTIQKKTLRKEKLSAFDKNNTMKSYNRLAVQLVNDFFDDLMALMRNARSALLEEIQASNSDKKGDDSMIENCAQLENAAAKLDGLETRFGKFKEENSENIPSDDDF